MTFEKASKFKQMDWEQPEHDENRTHWEVGKGKIPSISKLDRDELEAVIRDFEKGIRKGEQVGPRVREFFALLDRVGREDPLVWQFYTKHFKQYSSTLEK